MKKRNGILRSRNGKKIRNFKLGNFLILTDTKETEKNYFEQIKKSLPGDVAEQINIKVIPSIKTIELVNRADEERRKDIRFTEIWLVFDRDQVVGFDKIIKCAQDKGICVAWSNPCFEIWLYAYFGKMPLMNGSVQCNDQFSAEYLKKVGKKYEKSDVNVYGNLLNVGDETSAINIAKKQYCNTYKSGLTLPSKMCSCTTAYLLVEKIKEHG